MEKRGRLFLLFVLIILSTTCVFASEIEDSLHLTIQTTDALGDVINGTFNFTFNISTSSNCNQVVYTNSSSLTTDSRGIISHYLNNTQLNYSEQYWLCYYRNGVLIETSKIVRTPYTFNSKNTTLGGTVIDVNLNMGNYNITTTGTGFFGFLGSLVSRITSLFVQNIDFTGNINGTGNVSASYFIGDGSLLTNIQTYNSTYSSYLYGLRNETLDTFNNYNSTWDNNWVNQFAYNHTSSTIEILGTNFTTLTNNLASINTTANIQTLINGTNANFANVEFNGGWTNGGASIINGNIFARAAYFYNITGLDTTTLKINGSLLPTTGWDDTFDVGSSLLRWKNLYLSGDARINGTIYYGNEGIPITALNETGLINSVNSTLNIQNLLNSTGIYTYNYNQTTATYNLYNDIWLSTYNSTYSSYLFGSRNETLDTFNNYNSTWDNNWVNQFAYNHTSSTIEILGTNFTTLTNNLASINTTANIQTLINGTNANFANVEFNGGWTNGGASIINGNIFARAAYFYNITGLDTTTLKINGSLLPTTGWDDTFDIGSSSLRWKNLYLSGDARINGTIYYGNEGIPITALNETGLINSVNTTLNIQNLYNATIPQWFAIYLNSGTNDSYLSTYNATYATYLYGLRNETLDTFNLYNSTWDNSFMNIWNYNQTTPAIDYSNSNFYNKSANVNTGVYNISTSGYIYGQPITGSIGSGIIWANGTNNFAEVTVNCTGLACSYSQFKVRLVNTTNDEKYCDIPAATVTLTDNQHSVYYVDNNCAVQSTTFSSFLTTSLSPGGTTDFMNVIAADGGIYNPNGLGIENKRIIKLRKLLMQSSGKHLSVIDGFNRELNTFPIFNVTEGTSVYLMDTVIGTKQNTLTDEIEAMYPTGINTWGESESTGLNITSCDTGTGIAICTNTNLYRRVFIFEVGYNDTADSTKLHQLLPSQTITYSTLAKCLDTETYPLTYTLPSFYQTGALMLYAYCVKPSDTSWGSGWLDLRTVQQASSTSGIDVNAFVPYTGASNNLNLGIYNLTTTGKVGIGTANPGYKLDVNGTIGVGYTGTTNGTIVMFNAVNDAYTILQQYSTDFRIDNTYGSTAGYKNFTIYTGGSERFRITNSGNVGIGTISPEKLLDINGTTNVAVKLINSGTNNATVEFGAYNRGYIYSYAGYNLALGAGGNADVITINSSGNVGIGTTTPSTKLEVAGDLNVSSGYIYGNGQYITGVVASSSVWNQSVTNIFPNNLGNNVGIGTTSPVDRLQVEGGNLVINNSENTELIIKRNNINIAIMGDMGVGGLNGGEVLLSNSSGSLMTQISGTRDTFFQGVNVGIGTATPTEKLVVNGSITSNYQSANFATGGMRVMMDLVFSNKLARIGTVAGGDSVTGTQLNLGIYTNNTERMRFDNFGNVGIGTTTPVALLTLNATSTNSNGGIKLFHYTNNSVFNYFSEGQLAFQNNSGVYSAVISSVGDSYFNGGNVGIGTTTPSTKLEVAGDLNVSSGYIYGNGQYITGVVASSSVWNQSATNIFPNNLGNNVGIGTATPTEKLVVNGSITSNYQSANFATGGMRVMMDLVFANKLARIGTVAGGDSVNGTQLNLGIYTNNTERMRFDNFGNVGIGTTSPGNSFSVTSSKEEWTSSISNTRSDPDTSIALAHYAGYGMEIQMGSSSESIYGLLIRDASTAGIFGVYGNGDVEYTGTLTDISDIRLKNNIVNLTNSLNKLSNLQGIKFNMNNSNKTEFGFSAQEVNKTFPELVSVINEEGYLGVNYIGFIPVITESIKELKDENEMLKQELCTTKNYSWCVE